MVSPGTNKKHPQPGRDKTGWCQSILTEPSHTESYTEYCPLKTSRWPCWTINTKTRRKNYFGFVFIHLHELLTSLYAHPQVLQRPSAHKCRGKPHFLIFQANRTLTRSAVNGEDPKCVFRFFTRCRSKEINAPQDIYSSDPSESDTLFNRCGDQHQENKSIFSLCVLFWLSNYVIKVSQLLICFISLVWNCNKWLR